MNMPGILTKWLNQFKEFWQRLDKSQKKRILITSGIAVITVVLGVVALTRPTYVTLVSNLSTKEIGEMSAILSENNIPHSLKDGGTSIVVNANDNGKAQIVLAQNGYPKGGITFEDAISMIGITTTESDRKQIWKQQQANDIAKKLMSHDSIEYAEVSLALPEQTVFLTSDKKEYLPTAYVMVKPKTRLTPEQVEGIVLMVSKSVERLDPENVTVVDNNLNVLNKHMKDDMISTANSQEELRTKKARELEEKVYNYFSVGQNDSFDTIRVVATPFLDFDRLKMQSKTISNPPGMDGGAIISSEEIIEKSENAAAGAVPGTDTNPGETTSPSYLLGTGGESSYDLRERRHNFAYDETLTEQERAIGYLVAEKSTMAISLWFGRNVRDESKLSDDFLSQVRIAESAATGIPVENITVNKYKLAAPEDVQKKTADVVKEILSDYGLFIILFLLTTGILIAMFTARKHAVEEDIASMEAAVALQGIPDRELEKESIKEIELEVKSEILKQIDKVIKEKPEAVAQLLRSWLSEDWEA
ncbi:MAG: flagellar M-ring protein FliF [Clostridiaceae bacterium]|nr:flagellar M-ring protein FliF [Clostridiaceae bacterium]